VRITGQPRWIATEDVARYRDAVGVAPPRGVPDAFLAPTRDALGGLLSRYARRHGPFLPEGPAARWGLPRGVVETGLEHLMAAGVLVRGEFRPGGVEREWCDPEVLRMLRRRSLARLRREVEPVEPRALARFLPAWQGIGTSLGGADRLLEVVGQLEGLALPASVLERDILPARVARYGARILDELLAAGEVVWVGAGSLGRDDGRVQLWRADRLAYANVGLVVAGSAVASRSALRSEPAAPTALAADARTPPPLVRPEPRATGAMAPDPLAEGGWLGVAVLGHLANRGASFYREILAAVLGAAGITGARQPTQRELLDALWDLVWAGHLTNDTFLPVRALRWPRSGRDRPAGRPRMGASGRVGPPEGAGRWSLVSEAIGTAVAIAGGTPPSDTERRHALALRLLDRNGLLTRDGAAAEDVPGGFAAIYPILREMEDRGRVRRGYFVEGLGGAQFALPGALDRLRAGRSAPGDSGGGTFGARDVRLLATTDPANPYGVTLPWPAVGDDGARATFPRSAGAYVVLVDGDPVIYLERGGKSVRTLPAFADAETAAVALRALSGLVIDGRMRSLQIARIDGLASASSPHRDALVQAGFAAGYRGLVFGSPGR
jgi:ATP-dependent Lhr-like helicase